MSAPPRPFAARLRDSFAGGWTLCGLQGARVVARFIRAQAGGGFADFYRTPPVDFARFHTS